MITFERLQLVKEMIRQLFVYRIIVLITLGLTAAASTDAAIHKKIFGSVTSTLIISNEEMNNIMKKESDLLIKDISRTINDKAKEQKARFFQYVIRYIRCLFIRKSIKGKGTIRAGQ